MIAEPSPAAESLARELGVTRTVAAWLERIGYADVGRARRFLQPRLSELTAPDAMVDRSQVSQRVAKAIRSGEVIAVFGDYDCDGITSAAILTEVIRELGGRAVPLVASRFDGGYGVSAAACRRIQQSGASLLVTCDCGSSDHESLARLQSAGVESVVIDHHLVPDRPLPAVGFLNPHRPECGFPYKGMASCGLVLSVAAELRRILGATLDVRRWLDLVAIGTIADVAPLDGDNRRLVSAGLRALRAARRPAVEALLSLAKIDASVPITGRDVAFRIAPHINAPGRLGSASLALDLLLSPTAEHARRLAERVQEISMERRQVQARMEQEATEEIERCGYHQQPAIVLGRQGWNSGVVGIVAGRLADRYLRPAVVVGFDAEIGRGSVRGPAGSRLFDALRASSGLLQRFGGHQAAAGLELRLDRLDEFRSAFCLAVQQLPAALVASADAPLPLLPGDDPSVVLSDLDRLEPCGEKNPRPRLSVTGELRFAREVTGGHLKLVLELSDRRRLGGFAVGQGAQRASLSGRVTLVGDLRHNVFPGADPYELFVEHIEAAAPSSRLGVHAG